VNGSPTSRPSSPRTVFPLCILIALLFALLVAAAPASAYDSWEHGGASKSTCDLSGCHGDKTPTNAACLQSGCHVGFTTSGSKKCWDCHAPGSAPASSCTGSCHRFQAGGDNSSYPTAFTHGATPHLGASGYGKTCVDCHGAGNAHHDAAAASVPTCATCHNGSIAAAPTGHAAYGTQCASCHTGMSIPSGDCATCHVGSKTSGAPQITSTNDLSCGDAACHAKIAKHSGTPISGAACTTCHAAHYESLGACATCHADPQQFHHGTAKATLLAECSGCHDGKTASAKQAHASSTCATCHTGMAKPPVPATCHNCHDAQGFGTATCTACHSASGVIGKETIHATDPAATVACTTCHEKHYEDLGACSTCHDSHAETHHGTATLADSQLKLAVTPALIEAHKKATLKGSLWGGGKALASQRIVIQARKLKAGVFKNVGVVKTGAGGRFSRVVDPRVGTEYRAVWRAPGASAQVQRPAIVTVELRVRQ